MDEKFDVTTCLFTHSLTALTLALQEIVYLFWAYKYEEKQHSKQYYDF